MCVPDRESPPQTLRADELVAGRSFCDPVHTHGDLATLESLRRVLRHAAAGRRSSRVELADEIGAHTLVVPDWAALEAAGDVTLIGFFGQARDDVDHAAIVALEEDIIARAATFPGLLAYHNTQLENGQWCNFVAFTSHSATAAITSDAVHSSAVAGAPAHYASLRLHRAALAGGCLGAAPASIRETLYFDFGEAPAWRAIRAGAPA